MEVLLENKHFQANKIRVIQSHQYQPIFYPFAFVHVHLREYNYIVSMQKNYG